MTANPALVQTHLGPHGTLVPAPFPGEVIVLRRPKVGFELDGVQTAHGKWSTSGALYLSNVRMVFVADKADPSGLVGFDIPLVYIIKEQLNQPIFGCNNLAGQVWPAVPGGGPAGELPPHNFKVLFKEGGMGTMYPLFYALTLRAKQLHEANKAAGVQQQSTKEVEEMVHKAFVDPNDPSTVYLTQPVDESQRLHTAPVYAANYGQDEKYEPMQPRQ